MAYLRSPIVIGDNKREYLSHEPWIHATFLMWAPHVWCCVTDFSSLTALLDYLVTNEIKAQSPSPDGKYQIIFNFVKIFHEPLDYVYLIFDRCVVGRLCQQTRFIVPVESVGADRVLSVPEDSGSHRHRECIFDRSTNLIVCGCRPKPPTQKDGHLQFTQVLLSLVSVVTLFVLCKLTAARGDAATI